MSGRLNYYFRQKVTEAELDLGFALLETAERALITDAALSGIFSSATVSQKAGTPNLTVDVGGPGVVYDKLGQRITWSGTQNVNVAQDENAVSTAVSAPANSKIVSVFAKFKRLLTDPRTDGNAVTVFFNEAESFEFIVRQGAEAVSPTPPALDATFILLADITLIFGQTQVLNANINVTGRREDTFVFSAGALSVRHGLIEGALAAVLAYVNAVTNASGISYAGGSAWLNGVTNPATTVEAQLDKIITDLISTANGASGAEAIGIQDRDAWLGGRTNPATNTFDAIDKIITDLGAVTASDDGSERIGAQAVAGRYSAGSVRSQLDEVCTAAATITGVKTYDANIQIEPARSLLFTTSGTPTARTGQVTGSIVAFEATTAVLLDAYPKTPGGTLITPLPENIPHGATVTAIAYRVDPVSDLAAVRVRMSFYRKSIISTARETLWTLEDPLTGAAYEAEHTFTSTGSHVIDRTAYSYFVEVVGEAGGAPANVVMEGPPRFTYTLPGIPMLAGGG
jgi:hypothetical protein